MPSQQEQQQQQLKQRKKSHSVTKSGDVVIPPPRPPLPALAKAQQQQKEQESTNTTKHPALDSNTILNTTSNEKPVDATQARLVVGETDEAPNAQRVGIRSGLLLMTCFL